MGVPGGNVLIGGATVHDDHDAALIALLAEWSSENSYADRIDNLTAGGGENDDVTLDIGITVFDDEADTVFGFGDDWLLDLS